MDLEHVDKQPINIEFLLKEFYSHKMETKTTIPEYVVHIEDSTSKIAHLKKPLSDEA